MNCGIYKIKNIISGKIYVGSSRNAGRRWYFHLHALRRGSHANSRLQAAFEKHGELSFEFSMIEICQEADLLVREQHWIDMLDTFRVGYNVASVAGRMPSQKGVTLTLEHRAKIGASKKGKKRKPFSEEWRAKLKAAARKPRPKQSDSITKWWSDKKTIVEVKCVSCGHPRPMIPSKVARIDPVKYQCRGCYLQNRKIAA